MTQINYDYLINQIQRDLPTLPTIVNELTNILENPNTSTMAVEDVVRGDQTMAAKILRVANTTFYRGAGSRVRDVKTAVGAVGFDKVKDVVLNNSVFKLFGNSKEDQFSLTGLWKHSLGVASIAREVAKYLGKSWHETAYTCGLVHDIGKVARYKLDEVDNTSYFSSDSKLAIKKEISFFKAELVNQSVRHDYLGYLLCKNWGLSAWVESVVMWHHEYQVERRNGVPSSEAHILIDIVIVANWLAQFNEFGFSGHNSPEMPSDALFHRLNLSSEHVKYLQQQSFETLKETDEFCEILEG